MASSWLLSAYMEFLAASGHPPLPRPLSLGAFHFPNEVQRQSHRVEVFDTHCIIIDMA